MKIHGNKIICGSVLKYCCPFESNVPRDVKFLPLKLIIPRYDRVDSVKIALGITNTDDVIKVPREFGKMCLNIKRLSRAPKVLAARTYS